MRGGPNRDSTNGANPTVGFVGIRAIPVPGVVA